MAPSTLATDYLSPFASSPGYVPPVSPGGVTGWGWPVGGGRFNAIHMNLIPKGPHRGKVMVWNRYPVVLKPGSTFDPNGNYWAFQAWSILDPQVTPATSTAAQPLYRNYLLPLRSVGPVHPIQNNGGVLADIFCSGHAWSPHGDLVVAGGAEFEVVINGGANDMVAGIFENGANFLFMFDPERSSQPFPAGQSPLYANELGLWLNPTAFQLHTNRYYPTVTISRRLSRTFGSVEVVMVAGGSDVTVLPGATDPRNTYETYEVRASTNPAFLAPDSSGSLPGPSHPTNPDDEIFEEYPRIHALGDGTMLLNGPAPKCARIDLNVQETQRAWNTSVGRTGTNWPHRRRDGSSVFFALRGAVSDEVLRACGSDLQAGWTDTSEFLRPTTGPSWSSLPAVPGGVRSHTNLVILPDASILMIGGDNSSGSVLTTALFRAGLGWSTVFTAGSTSVPADSPTQRRYHATAVLLPDGRVLVGGGEGRDLATDRDYDIFVPHYLQGSPPPLRPTIVNVVGATLAGGAQPYWEMSNGDANLVLKASDLDDAAQLEKIVLLAPGSTTHHSDMSARYVEVPSTALAHDQRRFDVPDNLTLLRGFYMLFAVNSAGIPSIANWVKIQ